MKKVLQVCLRHSAWSGILKLRKYADKAMSVRGSHMIAKVLIDNITKNDLICEWGLSFYIEYNGHKILLDTGASGNFAENAKQMGIHLDEIEYGVLSHAHYDHANGMPRFFRENSKAKFYLRETAGENCYFKKFIFHKY